MSEWKRWFDAYGKDTASVVPPGATSDLAKHILGKVMGHKRSDGRWVGDTGPMADRCMTLERAKQAHRDGAGVGILGRAYPAVDIDVEHEEIAADMERTVIATLGPAPVRVRAGSSRRLLMYAGAGLRKRRIEFRTSDGQHHAIELLATGQYYNVAGIHPSGVPYEWRGEHPCDLGPYGLTMIGEEAIKACF